MSNSIIASLPVVEAPKGVNSSLAMNNRFGVVQVGKEYVKVDAQLFFAHVVTEVKGDPLPISEIKVSAYCSLDGELYTCSGRFSPHGMVIPTNLWLSTLRYKLGCNAEQLIAMSFHNSPWNSIK